MGIGVHSWRAAANAAAMRIIHLSNVVSRDSVRRMAASNNSPSATMVGFSASDGVSADIDGRLDIGARTQHGTGAGGWFHKDLHWNALDHLHEISRRVLRRK